MPPGMNERIATRRDDLAAYGKRRTSLMQLFGRCANGEINSKEFFDQLPEYWSYGFIAKFWEEATQANTSRLSVNLG
jgi:hypothetical protein